MKPTHGRIVPRGADFRPQIELLEDRLVPGKRWVSLVRWEVCLRPLAELLGPGILFGSNCAVCDLSVSEPASPAPTALPAGQSAHARPQELAFDWLSGPSQDDPSAPSQTSTPTAPKQEASSPLSSNSTALGLMNDPLADDLFAANQANDSEEAGPGQVRGITEGEHAAGSTGGHAGLAAPVNEIRTSAGNSAQPVSHKAESETAQLALMVGSALPATAPVSLDDRFATSFARTQGSATPYQLYPGYVDPNFIKNFYGFSGIPSLANNVADNGKGITIAIIDAYRDPNIASDLDVFDKQFFGPQAAMASTFLTQVYTRGTSVVNANNVPTNRVWAGEMALDVEWAHAIAPGAKIMLVEAASNSFANLFGAVDVAVSKGANVVSMSWGSGEFLGENGYDSHFQKSGVTFVASSGDSAGVVEYPSASPYVLSVGGTSLPYNDPTQTPADWYQPSAGDTLIGTQGTPEKVWNWAPTGYSGGAGGGASAYESKPAFQSGETVSGSKRGTPDVSYNADPDTGFYVYDSYGSGGWTIYGGTSIAAPQWAGLVALADQGRVAAGKGTLSTTDLTTGLYSPAAASSFNDVTIGYLSANNSATVGYDLSSGLGTPRKHASAVLD